MLQFWNNSPVSASIFIFPLFIFLILSFECTTQHSFVRVFLFGINNSTDFIQFIHISRKGPQAVDFTGFFKKTPRDSIPWRVYFLQIIVLNFYNILKFFKLLPCILFRAFAPHPGKSRPSPPWADGVRAPHRHRSDSPTPP